MNVLTKYENSDMPANIKSPTVPLKKNSKKCQHHWKIKFEETKLMGKLAFVLDQVHWHPPIWFELNYILGWEWFMKIFFNCRRDHECSATIENRGPWEEHS